MQCTLHVCTVASHHTRSLEQLQESCKRQHIFLDVLGLGESFEGFGAKFLYVQKYLEKLPESDVVLFVDAYDTLVLASPEHILKTFFSMDVPLVVSAEENCYPYAERRHEFPQGPTSFNYINSGAYIGYVGYLKELFKALSPFTAKDDDQGLFTLYYLKHPEKLTLDRRCQLFLNMYGFDGSDLIIDANKRTVQCIETGTTISVIHGQRRSIWYQYIYDLFFLAKAIYCDDKTVFLAILAHENEDILPKYLGSLDALDYNKKLITLYINVGNSHDQTQEILTRWYKEHESQYSQVIFDVEEPRGEVRVNPFVWIPQRYKIPAYIREKSVQKAQEIGSDYYFAVDCDNFIAPCTLKELISKDKPIIAPMLLNDPKSNDVLSNYCIDVAKVGKTYYQGHLDHLRVYKREVVGTFPVHEIFGTYLIQSKYLEKIQFQDETNDFAYLVFSRSARKAGVDQYICNEKDFGVKFSGPPL